MKNQDKVNGMFDPNSPIVLYPSSLRRQMNHDLLEKRGRVSRHQIVAPLTVTDAPRRNVGLTGLSLIRRVDRKYI
jgi:hypothetical protein